MNRKQRRARAAQIQSNDKPRYPQTIYQSEDIDPAVLANAAAMESASDADRDWFTTNPGRSYLLRPIAAAELAFDERRRPPDGSGLAAYAIVKQFKPGLRLRVFFISHPFHRVESFSDAACETLFGGIIQEECLQITDTIKVPSSVGGR